MRILSMIIGVIASCGCIEGQCSDCSDANDVLLSLRASLRACDISASFVLLVEKLILNQNRYGVLITQQFLLTLASNVANHAERGIVFNGYLIAGPIINGTCDPPCSIRRPQDIYVDRGFFSPGAYIDNIAVIKTNKPFIFTDVIIPAQIAPQFSPVGKKVKVYFYAHNQGQKVDATVIPYKNCSTVTAPTTVQCISTKEGEYGAPVFAGKRLIGLVNRVPPYHDAEVIVTSVPHYYGSIVNYMNEAVLPWHGE